MNCVTYEIIKTNPEIMAYIESGNKTLGVLGYTDHSRTHSLKVAVGAGLVLEKLGYSNREIELAKIAGYMHDIGNCINRTDHAHNGALMAGQILKELGMECREAAEIMAAIGNHDEATGTAVNQISAALILADKSDVRISRVRNRFKENFDIHDRVNFAAKKASLNVDKAKMIIHIDISLDENICSVLDYFEIFLLRMLMCKKAAEYLGCKLKITANDSNLL